MVGQWPSQEKWPLKDDFSVYHLGVDYWQALPSAITHPFIMRKPGQDFSAWLEWNKSFSVRFSICKHCFRQWLNQWHLYLFIYFIRIAYFKMRLKKNIKVLRFNIRHYIQTTFFLVNVSIEYKRLPDNAVVK